MRGHGPLTRRCCSASLTCTRGLPPPTHGHLAPTAKQLPPRWALATSAHAGAWPPDETLLLGLAHVHSGAPATATWVRGVTGRRGSIPRHEDEERSSSTSVCRPRSPWP